MPDTAGLAWPWWSGCDTAGVLWPYRRATSLELPWIFLFRYLSLNTVLAFARNTAGRWASGMNDSMSWR